MPQSRLRPRDCVRRERGRRPAAVGNRAARSPPCFRPPCHCMRPSSARFAVVIWPLYSMEMTPSPAASTPASTSVRSVTPGAERLGVRRRASAPTLALALALRAREGCARTEGGAPGPAGPGSVSRAGSGGAYFAAAAPTAHAAQQPALLHLPTHSAPLAAAEGLRLRRVCVLVHLIVTAVAVHCCSQPLAGHVPHQGAPRCSVGARRAAAAVTCGASRAGLATTVFQAVDRML